MTRDTSKKPSETVSSLPSNTRHEELFHDEAMYAIQRVDTSRHRQNAWLVHLTRGGRTIQMTFSDGTYGGKEQALEVAQAYRDAVLRVVPPLTNNDMRMLVRKNRSEGSNLPGVYYIERGGNKSAIWMARIEIALDESISVPPGKRRRRHFTRTFNVSRYGYEGARRMAEEERIRMVLAGENGEDPALRSPQARALHEKLTKAQRGS